MRLELSTFNIRNINDRYSERMPHLGRAFAALNADIVGLQEVTTSDGGPGKPPQHDFLSSQAPERHYKSLLSPHAANNAWNNAIMCAVGQIHVHETLRLSTGRSAQRVLVFYEGRTIWFANTHLHHVPEEPEVRAEQARAIAEWMAAAPRADATFVVGDFNTPPFEPAYQVMLRAGYRSAFVEANGAEPPVTWPSGIQAPTMDTDGEPNCLDYIWCSGEVSVVSARLSANEHVVGDPTLYPSDHFAIVATVELA
jgi:endonuclease/exonuclease/phosphatase family metal-dependent hydrolase